MAVVAIIMSLNFAACSDDDEDIDVSQLEGTWGLVRSAGWELCSEETEKDEWDDSYNPYNPDEDCSKLVIKKLEDNKYSVTGHDYSYSQWKPDRGSQIMSLNPIIEVLTSDKMILHIKYDNVQTDPEFEPEHRHSGDFTETFTRME